MKIVFMQGRGVPKWNYRWTPTIKDYLDREGVENVFETLPNPMAPKMDEWMSYLDKTVNPEDIILGHSSGAVAAMRYAEKNKIREIILVAPHYLAGENEDEIATGFFNKPWDWNSIKKNVGRTWMFYSRDDPHIDLEEFEIIEKNLGTFASTFKDKGHFIQREFPELIYCLDAIISEYRF